MNLITLEEKNFKKLLLKRLNKLTAKNDPKNKNEIASLKQQIGGLVQSLSAANATSFQKPKSGDSYTLKNLGAAKTAISK